MASPRPLRTIARAVRQHHRQARAATGKGIVRQAVEIAYAKLRGFSSADYYILPLYRGDRWDYLGQPAYSRLNAHLNPAYAGVVGFNKWVSWHFFVGAGLPTPAVHGFYHPRRGVERDGRPLRTRDLGWDVGVTPDGPVLIETNSYWAPHTSQKPDNNLVKLAYGTMLSKAGRAGPIPEHPSPSA